MQTSKAKYDYQKSPGFRDRLRIGAAIAIQLPQLMGAKECAKHFGISTQMLRRIECEALFKVGARLTEILKRHQEAD